MKKENIYSNAFVFCIVKKRITVGNKSIETKREKRKNFFNITKMAYDFYKLVLSPLLMISAETAEMRKRRKVYVIN